MTKPRAEEEQRFAIAEAKLSGWVVVDQQAKLVDPIVCRCVTENGSSIVATALNFWYEHQRQRERAEASDE